MNEKLIDKNGDNKNSDDKNVKSHVIEDINTHIQDFIKYFNDPVNHYTNNNKKNIKCFVEYKLKYPEHIDIYHYYIDKEWKNKFKQELINANYIIQCCEVYIDIINCMLVFNVYVIENTNIQNNTRQNNVLCCDSVCLRDFLSCCLTCCFF